MSTSTSSESSETSSFNHEIYRRNRRVKMDEYCSASGNCWMALAIIGAVSAFLFWAPWIMAYSEQRMPDLNKRVVKCEGCIACEQNYLPDCDRNTTLHFGNKCCRYQLLDCCHKVANRNDNGFTCDKYIANRSCIITPGTKRDFTLKKGYLLTLLIIMLSIYAIVSCSALVPCLISLYYFD